jgi:hypothetical protein
MQDRFQIIDGIFDRKFNGLSFEFPPEIEELVREAMQESFREGQLSKMFGDDYKPEQ